MSEVKCQYQVGYYLKGLLRHISAVLPQAILPNFDSGIENLGLILTPKDHGRGRDIGYQSYQAVLQLKCFPVDELAPEIVMASVMAWLMDNDKHREQFQLADPVVSMEPEAGSASECMVNITIKVDFREPLMVVEDEKGLVLWEDKRWTVAPYEIWVAEHGDVIAANQPASPIEKRA